MKLRKQNKSKTITNEIKSALSSTERSRKYWERIYNSKHKRAAHNRSKRLGKDLKIQSC